MIKNYFKIALRNLYKNKLYASVNIIGLTVGITSCLLIGIYILHELSYDRFHKNAERIVRVTMDYNSGDAVNKVAVTGTKVGPEFRRTFPEVEAFTRTLKSTRVISYQDKSFEEDNFLYADSAFLGIFSYPLESGNPVTALSTPDKLVLTKRMVRKYFGNENPVGKIVKVGGTKDFIVTAVIADASENSQIKFDFIGSFSSLNASKIEKWWEANYITYLLLNKNSPVASLQPRITEYMKKISKELNMAGSSYLTFHLEPLTRVHLYSALDGFEPNNNITYIYILAIVAFLILFIASVNYTNLATAQSAGRTAEIGIRKVMGARRMQVFRQFVGESLLITGIAVVLAILLAYILLPLFNELSGKELQPGILFQPVTLLSLAGLGIVVGLAAGSYPALLLSNIKLIRVLKSGFSFSSAGQGLRKSLIVLQFVISIFLIICTSIVLQQLNYIQSKDLGYSKEQVIVLPLDFKMSAGFDDMKKSFLQVPGVKYVSAAYEEPTDIGWGDGIIVTGPNGETKNVTINAIPVDEDFIKTMDIKIIAGSDYTLADVQSFDTSNGGRNLRYTFMLNESAVKAIGWTPEQAIGKTISKGNEGIVKAVIRDFHFRSFHEPITPLVIFMDKRMSQKIFVKVTQGNPENVLASLERNWKQRVTHRPFEYHFLDEDYDALYKTEQRTGAVFTTFSSLAILLACLGLFGLTAYAVVQRTKEIGIRKVLGANISSIISLLSKDFLLLVIVALLIAAPVSWIAASKWLEDFSYRIDVKWWVFAVAGISTFAIALLTISIQAIKAALANPVKSLRTE